MAGRFFFDLLFRCLVAWEQIARLAGTTITNEKTLESIVSIHARHPGLFNRLSWRIVSGTVDLRSCSQLPWNNCIKLFTLLRIALHQYRTNPEEMTP